MAEADDALEPLKRITSIQASAVRRSANELIERIEKGRLRTLSSIETAVRKEASDHNLNANLWYILLVEAAQHFSKNLKTKLPKKVRKYLQIEVKKAKKKAAAKK